MRRRLMEDRSMWLIAMAVLVVVAALVPAAEASRTAVRVTDDGNGDHDAAAAAAATSAGAEDGEGDIDPYGFDPSLSTEEAPSGDDGTASDHADISLPVEHGATITDDGGTHTDGSSGGRGKGKPKKPKAAKPTKAKKPHIAHNPPVLGREGLTPLTTEAQWVYSIGGNDTDGHNTTAAHQWAHDLLPTGPNVNVTKTVVEHENGTVVTTITTVNGTHWHQNVTTETPDPTCPVPRPDDPFPTFCCMAKADPVLEPEQFQLGGYCVYCPQNCTCGVRCGECACEEIVWEYEPEFYPTPREVEKKPRVKVQHKKRRRRRRRVIIRRARKKKIRKHRKRYVKPKHPPPYIEPKRPAGAPIRPLITPWGPLPDDFYTRQYAPQAPPRSSIEKPGCKPKYKMVNVGLTYPTVTLTPKKLNYEGPVIVSGQSFQTLFHTGKALSFWLSALCKSEGTETIPRLPGYAITQPLIQVRANEGTPGVQPQEMQAFGAKAPTIVGGEDIGLHYFGAVFAAENVFGEGEQFIHDGLFGLGALVDMPLHIPVVGHKSAMDAFRDTLLLKHAMALDAPHWPGWRKICDDAQLGMKYALFDPDGRYSCLRVSRVNQLQEKTNLFKLALPLPLPFSPDEELFLVREQQRLHLKEQLKVSELDPMWEIERKLHIEAYKLKSTVTPAPVLPLMMAYAASSPPRMAAIAAEFAAAASSFPDLPKKLAELKEKAAEQKKQAQKMKEEKEKKEKEEKKKKEEDDKKKKEEKEKKDKEKEKEKKDAAAKPPPPAPPKFRQLFESRKPAAAKPAGDRIKELNTVLLEMRGKLKAQFGTEFTADTAAAAKLAEAERRLNANVAVRSGQLLRKAKRLRNANKVLAPAPAASGAAELEITNSDEDGGLSSSSSSSTATAAPVGGSINRGRRSFVIDGSLDRINAARDLQMEHQKPTAAAAPNAPPPTAATSAATPTPAKVNVAEVDEDVVEGDNEWGLDPELLKRERRSLVEVEAEAEHATASRTSLVRTGPELNLFFAYYLAESGGCFVWGGWDGRFHSDPIRWFQAAHFPTSWTLPLLDILYDGKSMGLCAGGCKAAIHTGAPLITGPLEKMIELQKKTPVNPLCVDLELLKPIEFVIGGALNPAGGPLRLVLEKEQLARKVDVDGGQTQCVAVFESQVRDTFFSEVWVLGVPFFKQWFSVFDWEKFRIGFAKSDPTFFDVHKCGDAGGLMPVVDGFTCASPAELMSPAMREIKVPTPPLKNPDGSPVFVPEPPPGDPPGMPEASPPAPGDANDPVPNEGPYVSPNPPSPPDWPPNRDPREWADDAQHKMLEEVKGSPPPDKEEGPYKAKEKGFLAKMKALLPDQLYFMGDPLADKGMQWNKELPKALADAAKDWKTPPVPKPEKPWFFRQIFGDGGYGADGLGRGRQRSVTDDDDDDYRPGDSESEQYEPDPSYGHFDSVTEKTLARSMGAPLPKTAAAMEAYQQRLKQQKRGARMHEDDSIADSSSDRGLHRSRSGFVEASSSALSQEQSEAELMRGIPLTMDLPADSYTRRVLEAVKPQLTKQDMLIERMYLDGTLPYNDHRLAQRKRFMAQKLRQLAGTAAPPPRFAEADAELDTELDAESGAAESARLGLRADIANAARRGAAAGAARARAEADPDYRSGAVSTPPAPHNHRAAQRNRGRDAITKSKPTSEAARRSDVMRARDRTTPGWNRVQYKYRDIYG